MLLLIYRQNPVAVMIVYLSLGNILKIGLFSLPQPFRIFSDEKHCAPRRCSYECQKSPENWRTIPKVIAKVTHKSCITFQPQCIHQPSDVAYNTPIDSPQCAQHA